MQHKGYANPYHWAAFTLIGDMGEVESIRDVPEVEPTATLADGHVTPEVVAEGDAGPTPTPLVAVVSPPEPTNWLWIAGVVLTLVVVGGALWRWKVNR